MSMQFNEEYYLENNADVASAVDAGDLGSGKQHWELFGAKEERNPNAVFNTAEYLEANDDVAESGMNPLDHFLQFGAAEGRAPNASYAAVAEGFDADDYLAANEDVADAVENGDFESAYQHWVMFGQFEDDRDEATFNDGTPVSDAIADNVEDNDGDDDDNGIEGDTQDLTVGADNLEGTADNDTFNAGIGQNDAGYIANTLSSADKIDGGAGNDTLNASLSAEVNLAGDALNVQPTTSSVENINIEARSNASDGTTGSSAGVVNLDAKNMTGVDTFTSDYSDGDLIIQNVNTLDDDDNARDTSSMTVGMDHTSNFDSINDASDLTVLFDDDYLLAGRVQDAATVSYEVMNQDAWDLINRADEEGVELLDGVVFQELGFDLNGEHYDLTAALGEEGNGQAIRTHEDLVDAINSALEELGVSDKVTAKIDGEFTERTAVETGEERVAPRVTLESTPGNELNATEDDAFLAAVPESERDVPASNRYDRAGQRTIDGEDLRTEIDVELEKVGRAGEGGDLQIGGKSQSETTGSGIQVFNIDVNGDASQPSNLGTITSTNNTLETINIATGEEFAGSGDVADLTIRGHGDNETFGGRYDDFNTGPFNGNITDVNAGDFEGNLTIGTEYAAQNLGMLNATGGGDVTFIGGNNDGGTHNVITGDGNDTIKITANNDSHANISTGGGDDTVTVGGPSSAEINTGAGDDVIRGNAASVTVDAGEGNDTIYAENTGDKGVAQLSTDSEFNTTAGTLNGQDVAYSELLYGREVQVTVAMPEEASTTADSFTDGYEVTAKIEASDGKLTTERDLYEAAAKAINEDPAVNQLVEASVDDAGNFNVNYLVDGVTVENDDLVQVEVLGKWDDLSGTEKSGILNELQEKYSDSEIEESDVEGLYNDANTVSDAAAQTADSVGTNSDSDGENVVNGGAGDDVIVLSSNDNTQDTVVFDQGGFGNDTIVHFNEGEDGDVLDFTAWLDNVTSASGSTDSETRVETTLADSGSIAENSVAVSSFDNLSLSGSNTTFENMSDSQVLDALNADTSFANTDAAADFVGNTQKSIVMFENNDNAGEYKVYEVTSEEAAGDDNFTGATLVGTADFGDNVDFTNVELA